MLRLPPLMDREELRVVAHRIPARWLDLQHVGTERRPGATSRRAQGARCSGRAPAGRRGTSAAIGRRVLHSRRRVTLVGCLASSRSPRSPTRPPTRPITPGTSSTTCPSSSRSRGSRSASAGCAHLAAAPSRRGRGALLEPFHYMTLYLIRDVDVLPEFFALGERLWAEDRFFKARRAVLSGPFEVVDALGGAAGGGLARRRPVPTRPRRLRRRRPPGRWRASGRRPRGRGRLAVRRRGSGRSPWPSSTATCGRRRRRSRRCRAESGPELEWAGPLERVDAFRWDWFATLTPQ